MGTMKDAKTYGGIGAILMLVGAFFAPVGIVGLILLFISVKTIADITKDRKIFDHFLYYFILAIVAMIAMGAMMFSAFFAAGGFDPAQITTGVGIMVIASLVVGWIFFVLSSLYLRKSYTAIYEKTNVDAFRTTGTLYFIGALLTIVVVGLIIIFVARIFEIIAYFGLPDDYAEKPMAGTEQPVERIV